jgi:trans-aconitate methyltransferase
MNKPKEYLKVNKLQRQEFQVTLDKFSSLQNWSMSSCDVLDVGCGSGDVTHDVLLPSLQCPSRLVGIDVSPAMVEFANANYKSDSMQFHCVDIATTDDITNIFPRRFDKIYSSCCLHWVKDHRYQIRVQHFIIFILIMSQAINGHNRK